MGPDFFTRTWVLIIHQKWVDFSPEMGPLTPIRSCGGYGTWGYWEGHRGPLGPSKRGCRKRGWTDEPFLGRGPFFQDKVDHRISQEIMSFLKNGFVNFRLKLSGTRPRECQNRIPRTQLCRIDEFSAQTAVWDAISWPKCVLRQKSDTNSTLIRSLPALIRH